MLHVLAPEHGGKPRTCLGGGQTFFGVWTAVHERALVREPHALPLLGRLRGFVAPIARHKLSYRSYEALYLRRDRFQIEATEISDAIFK